MTSDFGTHDTLDTTCRSCLQYEFKFENNRPSELCVFCILFLLNDKECDAMLREALIRRMYDISDSDFEFVLPQLYQLYLTASEDTISSLYLMLVFRLSSNVHLAIRGNWWGQSAAYYLDSTAAQRAYTLSENVEMELVNGPLVPEGTKYEGFPLVLPEFRRPREEQSYRVYNPYKKILERTVKPATRNHNQNKTDNKSNETSVHPHDKNLDTKAESTVEKNDENTSDIGSEVASDISDEISVPSDNNIVLNSETTFEKHPTENSGEYDFEEYHSENKQDAENVQYSEGDEIKKKATDNKKFKLSMTIDGNNTTSESTSAASVLGSPSEYPKRSIDNETKLAGTTTTPDSIKQQQQQKPLSSTSLSSLQLSSSNSNTTLVATDSMIDFIPFYKKKIRADYFASQLNYFQRLQQASEALVKYPREERKRRLPHLTKRIPPTGLYLPLGNVNENHHMIRRLIIEESIVLNSRDKAPFLLWYEIEDTNLTNGDPNSFLAFQEFIGEDLAIFSPHVGQSNTGSNYMNNNNSNTIESESPLPNSPEVGPGATSENVMEGMSQLSIASTSTTSTTLTPVSTSTTPTSVSSILTPTLADDTSKPQHIPRVSSPFGESVQDKTDRLLGYYYNTPVYHDAVNRDPVTCKTKQGKNVYNPANDKNYFPPRTPPSLLSLIFKGGDDVRQEVLAMQLIKMFDMIWSQAGLPLLLRPYTILATSHNSGLLETVTGTTSIDGLKKSLPSGMSMAEFFEDHFGPRTSSRFQDAQMCFVQSMAAYSLVCYFLQVKDRHNGNILLDSDGRVVHIDFGFMLSSSPGGNMNFENVPFKLTEEYIRVMDGQDSEPYNNFSMLFMNGFLEARKHAHKIILLVEIMSGANMMAFSAGPAITVQALKDRFFLDKGDTWCLNHAMQLIQDSTAHWRSSQYDIYQKFTNGIL